MQESVEALLAQVEAGDQAVVAIAMDGRVAGWNAAAVRLLGVPSATALGRQCARMVAARTLADTPACRADCPILAMARSGRPASPEDLVANRRPVRVQHLVLRDAAGVPALLLHLFDDVAAHRSVEAVGRRAQRLLALDQQPDRHERRLTRREREVLALLCRGLTARDIAGRLGISYTTARTHVQRLNAKLDAHNRAAVIAAALGEPEA